MKSGWANIAATLHILCITNAIWWSCKSKLWLWFYWTPNHKIGPLLTWYCLFLDTRAKFFKKRGCSNSDFRGTFSFNWWYLLIVVWCTESPYEISLIWLSAGHECCCLLLHLSFYYKLCIIASSFLIPLFSMFFFVKVGLNLKLLGIGFMNPQT